MPVYSSQLFGNTPDGRQHITPVMLAQHGPIIDVTISIPQPLARTFRTPLEPLDSILVIF
jgi:hypothetical protein